MLVVEMNAGQMVEDVQLGCRMLLIPVKYISDALEVSFLVRLKLWKPLNKN